MWDDVEEETPAPAEPAPAEATAAEAAAPADAPKPEEAEPPAPEATVYGTDENKRLVFKHWIRPRSSQYGYITDYQKNYYDDIIHYLDRRNKGLPVDRPRAQTWGERALRTYLSKSSGYFTTRSSKDAHLLHYISIGAKFQRFHSKQMISRKYSRLGFNTVTI